MTLSFRPLAPVSFSAFAHTSGEAHLAFVSTIYFLLASEENPPLLVLSLSLSLPLMLPLFPVLYRTLRSCSRRGGQPAESSRDFVDYNKCVCSSREYRSSSLVPSFYFSSSTFFPSLSLIIVLCCHRWLPIRPFGRTPPPPPLQTTTA